MQLNHDVYTQAHNWLRVRVAMYHSRMTFTALISDLDGTLLDTLDDLAGAVNTALKQLGLPQHPVEKYRYFVGDGRRTLALRSLPEGRRDDVTLEQILQIMNDGYMKQWMGMTRPYPGIPEMLDALTERGIRLAVLSNKPHDYTEATVATLLSQWRFEHVLGEAVDNPKKPDPSCALRIAELMNVTPEQCVYIGDSGVDMKTAHAAGMYPVGVLWGFREATELLSEGAALLAHRPADIVRLFG